MRKTRNFLRRAGSAALALTLTVSLCQPAFAAAKAPFSKDETVYAVMAADGSVTKTTVSEHLYNADGLAGVEDRSTLKNIVNTRELRRVHPRMAIRWSGTPTTPMFTTRATRTVSCPSLPK